MSPTVTSVALASPPTLLIDMCIDLEASDLVRVTTGASVKDPAQPKRYVITARVVDYGSPDGWLVQQTEVKLQQPC